MKVKEVMSGNLRTCTPESSLQEVASLMVECDCGAVPIVDGNKPVGIITDRDIIIRTLAKGENPLNLKAGSVMTGSTVCVKQEDDVQQVVDLMEKEQLRRILVTDENNQLCGIVAQADIALHSSEQNTGEAVRKISQ